MWYPSVSDLCGPEGATPSDCCWGQMFWALTWKQILSAIQRSSHGLTPPLKTLYQHRTGIALVQRQHTLCKGTNSLDLHLSLIGASPMKLMLNGFIPDDDLALSLLERHSHSIKTQWIICFSQTFCLIWIALDWKLLGQGHKEFTVSPAPLRGSKTTYIAKEKNKTKKKNHTTTITPLVLLPPPATKTDIARRQILESTRLKVFHSAYAVCLPISLLPQ